MLRDWRKKVRAKRLGTPVKIGQGEYTVPCTEYVRADGKVRREISMKSIKMMLIAEEIGTDDPDLVMREYTRQEFIAYVKRMTEPDIKPAATEVAGPQLPPVYHKPGKIIAFPGTEVKQPKVDVVAPASNGAPVHQSESLGRANILARPADVTLSADESQPEPIQIPAAEKAPELQPIIDMPVKKAPTEAELIAAAIEEVLKAATTDEDRRLLSEWMEQHPDYVQSAALDDHVRFSLSIYNGVVRARYARYAQPVACEA